MMFKQLPVADGRCTGTGLDCSCREGCSELHQRQAAAPPSPSLALRLNLSTCTQSSADPRFPAPPARGHRGSEACTALMLPMKGPGWLTQATRGDLSMAPTLPKAGGQSQGPAPSGPARISLPVVLMCPQRRHALLFLEDSRHTPAHTRTHRPTCAHTHTHKPAPTYMWAGRHTHVRTHKHTFTQAHMLTRTDPGRRRPYSRGKVRPVLLLSKPQLPHLNNRDKLVFLNNNSICLPGCCEP